MRGFLVIVLGIILLWGVVPISAQTDVMPRLEAVACPVTVTTERAVECGVLVAALDNDDQTAAIVRLPVAVLSGGIGAANRTPVIFLSGADGHSVFDSISALNLAALAGRDVIIMEQRGGKYAQPALDCPEIASALQTVLGEALTHEVQQARLGEIVDACQQRLIDEGVDLSAFGIGAQAADVNALMALLGYERYSLYGVSLGAALAQAVAREQLERVESVILDSPLLSGADVPVGAQAFDRLANACTADAACNQAYHDLAGMFYGLVEQLEATPVEVNVTASDGTSRRVILTGHRLMDALTHEMSQTDRVATVPMIIRAAASGDYTQVADALVAAWQSAATTNIATVYSALCTRIDAIDTTSQTGATARWESVSISPLFDAVLCDRWNSGVQLSAQEVVAATPILVMTGAYDPFAATAGAEITGEQTLSRFSVVLPARSRNVLWNGDVCADGIAAAFLESPAVAPNPSCAQDNTVPFIVPSVEISTPAAAQTYSGNGFTSVVPEGWSALAPGVFGGPNADLLLFLRLDGVAVANAAEVFLSRTRVEPGDVGEITIEAQTAGSYTWTVTQLTFPEQDLIALIGATEAGGVSYLVILQSPTAQFEGVRVGVWLPALEAFVITR